MAPSTNAIAPTRPDNPATLPRTPEITANSVSAPAIPVNPRAISPHVSNPISVSAEAMLARDLDASTITKDPTNPDNPASLPRDPETTANSVSAPPIAVKPRAISPQDIPPNSVRAPDISSRDCTSISIPILPTRDLNPPTFLSMFNVATSSPIAKPIAVKPLLISPQDNDPSSERDLAIDFILAARTVKATIADALIFTLFIALRPNERTVIAPPIPNKPFTISEKDRPANCFMAPAKISIALAISIIDTPALMKPLLLNTSSVFVSDLKETLSMANNVPTANKDLVMSAAFSPDNVFNACASIVTAKATDTKDVILIPLVNDFKASLVEANISDNVVVGFAISLFPNSIPNIPFPVTSFIVSNTPFSFLAAANTPAPPRPIRTSSKEILPVSHSKPVFTAVTIFSTALETD